MSLDETRACDRVEATNADASRPTHDPSRPIRVEVSRLMEVFQMIASGIRSVARKGILPKPSTGGYFFDASITSYVIHPRRYAKGRPNRDSANNGQSDRSRPLEAKHLSVGDMALTKLSQRDIEVVLSRGCGRGTRLPKGDRPWGRRPGSTPEPCASEELRTDPRAEINPA
jgi:hypothetical protein